MTRWLIARYAKVLVRSRFPVKIGPVAGKASGMSRAQTAMELVTFQVGELGQRIPNPEFRVDGPMLHKGPFVRHGGLIQETGVAGGVGAA